MRAITPVLFLSVDIARMAGSCSLCVRGEDFLPVFDGRHVVPGFEGCRERADVGITQQHRNFKRLQTLVTEIIDGEHGADLVQHFLIARLFGPEPTLQCPATELQGPARRIGVGFASGKQFGEHAFQLRGNAVLRIQRPEVFFCLFYELAVHGLRMLPELPRQFI